MDKKTRRLIQKNLRHLCTGYGSISEAAKVMGINRQQFNKYLSGSSFPSLTTLAKIARANAIEIDDLVLEADLFADRIQNRHAPDSDLPGGLTRAISGILAHGKATNSFLSTMTGSYLVCLRSATDDGTVNVSYAKIFQKDGLTFQKALSPLVQAGAGNAPLELLKHEALVLETAGLLHFIRIRNLGRPMAEIGLKLIIPSYFHGQNYLRGYVLTSERARQNNPLLFDVLMKRVSDEPVLTAVRRYCGIFPVGDPRLDPAVSAFFSDKTTAPGADAAAFLLRQQNILTHFG